MNTVTRLLSAATQHHIILIPEKNQLHIVSPSSAPADLVETLRKFSAEIAATLRGQQRSSHHW